ncbi:MAG: hypothetical protein U0270_29430 [Labilithrix sp.]
MKKSLLTSLALASVLSLGAFGCASNHDDATGNAAQEVHASPTKSISASAETRFESLGGVWSVRGIDNEAGMQLAVIEFGGGDPALNGDYLFLSAYGPDHGDGGVFELGMNVSQLESATMVGPDAIKLVGTQDTIDPQTDDFKKVPFEATVKLTLVDRDIQPNVSLTRDGQKPETIARTAEESKQFFTSIFTVQNKESKGGNIVRLFETGGGDPAMNGDQLVLNIMSYPEEKNYDLGLNVNTVSKFEVTDTQVLLEGSEDIMDANGDIKSRPFAYTIDYTIGEDGAPAPSIKLTRTR